MIDAVRRLYEAGHLQQADELLASLGLAREDALSGHDLTEHLRAWQAEVDELLAEAEPGQYVDDDWAAAAEAHPAHSAALSVSEDSSEVVAVNGDVVSWDEFRGWHVSGPFDGETLLNTSYRAVEEVLEEAARLSPRTVARLRGEVAALGWGEEVAP